MQDTDRRRAVRASAPDPNRTANVHTNRPHEDPDAAPAMEPPGVSVLVIADVREAQGVPRLLGSDAAAALHVTVVDGLDAALERLQEDAFDAVLLGVDSPDSPRSEGVRRVREVAPGTALIVVGGDPGAPRTAEPDVDGWIVGGDSANAVAECVRGAVERRRLREALRRQASELEESEARFHSIIQRTADGIVIVDEGGRVRFVNPAAEQLFGRTAAELVGHDFGVAVLTGETAEMDIVRRAEGESAVAELRVSATTWDGAAAQVISLRDVTDRKRAEEQARQLVLETAAREQAEKESERSRFLAEAGARLDSSLDPEATLVSLAKLIVPHMADWCVIDLLEGDRIRRVAGAHSDPQKQDLLRTLIDRFSPYADSPQPAARVLRSGEVELYRDLDTERLRELTVDDTHARLLLQLGTRSILAVPLDARERRLGVMTFACGERDFNEASIALAREIASRAARALDNARLYEAALAASRTKSEFLAVMSHELRTPLNAIVGYTDLLLAGIRGDMDSAQNGYLRRIHASAMQLLQIIEEILAYAQMEAGRAGARPEPIRIGELASQVVAIAEPLAREKGLEFRWELQQPEATLFTDAGKLRQIMLNLLANSVKFTERGAVALTIEVHGDDLVIAVTDTGIGIAPEAMETIFEPFRQLEQGTTRRAGGTGLGLSVSRRLARLLGGDLSVESRPGYGSTFTITVPRRIAATHPSGE